MPPFQNPFMALRQKNLLSGPSSRMPLENPRTPQRFGAGPMQEPQRPQRPMSYEDDLMDLQNQIGPGLQAYKDHLAQMPQRDDYSPGVMTRIASALSGASAGFRDPGEGIKVAQGINSSNYAQALGDYQNKGVGLREQAGLEQDELDSKVKALQNARAMGLKYDEFALKRLEADAKNRVDETNAGSSRMRAEAYVRSVDKPGYEGQAQEDGSVLYVNKADPSDTMVVPAKTIVAGQLGVARTNATTNRINAGTSQANARTAAGNLDNARTRTSIYSRDVDSRSADRTQRSPREQQDAEDNALLQMKSDPLFKKFITNDDNGYPTVADDDNSDDYVDFIDALNAKIDEVLAGRARRPNPRLTRK